MNTSIRKRHGLLALFFAAALIPGTIWAQNITVGETAPSFNLDGHDGTLVSSDEYAGKIIMLFFLGYG
jgi:hypothetical protein